MSGFLPTGYNGSLPTDEDGNIIYPPGMQNQQPVFRQPMKEPPMARAHGNGGIQAPASAFNPNTPTMGKPDIPDLRIPPAPAPTPRQQAPAQQPDQNDWFQMGQPQPLHIQQTQWQSGPQSNPTYQEPHWTGQTLNGAIRNGLDAFLAQGQYPGMAPFQQPGTVMPKYNMTQTPMAAQLGTWNPYQAMPYENTPYYGNFMGATPATLRQASTVLPFSMPS